MWIGYRLMTITDAGLLRRAFEATSFPVMITDAEGAIVSVNAAFAESTGWPAEAVSGKTPALLASGRHDADFYEAMWSALQSQGSWHGELWNRRKDGALCRERLTIDALRGPDGAVTHFVAVFHPCGQCTQGEAHQSNHSGQDEVTGLPNRALFLDRLDRALALARRRGGQVAVQLVNLDGFKPVNDAFGHESGDLLLRAVGERLKASLRDSDTVARWGGDEFAVVLPVIDGARCVREAGLRMLAALRRPFYMAGDEIAIGASMGAAVFPADGATPIELVKLADRAMYEVKRGGRGGFAFHDEAVPGEPARRKAG